MRFICIGYYIQGNCGFLKHVLSSATAIGNDSLVAVQSVVFCGLGFALSGIANILIDIVLK
jgi:hypothetical protein